MAHSRAQKWRNRDKAGSVAMEDGRPGEAEARSKLGSIWYVTLCLFYCCSYLVGDLFHAKRYHHH